MSEKRLSFKRRIFKEHRASDVALADKRGVVPHIFPSDFERCGARLPLPFPKGGKAKRAREISLRAVARQTSRTCNDHWPDIFYSIAENAIERLAMSAPKFSMSDDGQ